VIAVGDCEAIDAAIAVVDGEGTILRYNRMFANSLLEGDGSPVTLEGLFGREVGREFLVDKVLHRGGGWSGTLPEGFGGWIDCYPTGDGHFLILFDVAGNREVLIREMIDSVQRDMATGLPNLTALHDVLMERYLDEDSAETYGALFLISFDDIYRFDHQGNGSKGDRVLQQLAEKIAELRQEGDYLAYIGSDKFAYVRPGVHRVHEAEEVARELLQLNAEPLSVDGELFYLNLSIGIAFYPLDSREATELVRLADRAMREAKHSGWNRYALYSQLRSDAPLEILDRLRRELPEAIEREHLYFVYQPQYCLRRERFVGAEVLARWHHPELGELMPELFIPLAEQTGMIRFLTMSALMQVSKTFEKLEARGFGDFSLSVNLSPSVIFHRDFLENLRFFLDHYALKDRPLHFEITENVFAHNMAVMAQTLEALRNLGIGIEIDDYGTGYTSLNSLVELPVDTVKIDRRYVRDIDRSHKTRKLYRAMIQTAEALGLGVVTEGVEREEEKRVVESHGPVVIQGWYCARAMEESALLKLLEDGGRR
jgi:diguanylate cyclase (GGDEF)-like protein